MVKDHSDSERGNPLPPHRLLFAISSGFLYVRHPTDRIIHTTAFVTPVVEHWLEREIGRPHEGSPSGSVFMLLLCVVISSWLNGNGALALSGHLKVQAHCPGHKPQISGISKKRKEMGFFI